MTNNDPTASQGVSNIAPNRHDSDMIRHFPEDTSEDQPFNWRITLAVAVVLIAGSFFLGSALGG